MAARKKKPRKKARRKNPSRPKAAPRKRRRRNPSTSTALAAPRRRRRRHAKRRSHVSHRRRSNPSTGSMMSMAKVVGLAVLGGAGGVFAAQQAESHIAQPPRTMGLLELALAGLGLYAGLKMKQPVLGIAFAAGMGAKGGMGLLGSFQPPTAGAPGMPGMPTTAGTFADPTTGAVWGAGGDAPPQMAAVVDVDDGDMGGAEGMAAVEDAIDVDEDGNPIFDDAYDPYGGAADFA